MDSAYSTFLDGALPSGAHYFVISKNTCQPPRPPARRTACLLTSGVRARADRFFDIETPGAEIGYEPQHDAEVSPLWALASDQRCRTNDHLQLLRLGLCAGAVRWQDWMTVFGDSGGKAAQGRFG